MKDLVAAIIANPQDFEPWMFAGHCGLQSLVRVCQEMQLDSVTAPRPSLILAMAGS